MIFNPFVLRFSFDRPKTVKLFCGNLTGEACTEENVKGLFEQIGEVHEFVLMTCYAFVVSYYVEI